ncbi:MAG: hypothetical protein JST50_03915 [Bacteroidetes bacterium]|jgi:hypothetical protein|nr:hypothetical protein [Bacteroidota bacterium]
MKKSTRTLLALILITIVFYGCSKSQLAPAPKNKLAASSLNATPGGLQLTVSNPRVSQNFADTVRINGISSSDSVHWFVSPNASVNSLQKTNSHYILSFSAPGTYRIKAVVNNSDSVSTSITVIDSVSTPPSYHLASITGDIKLTPHFHQGSSADSTYLFFTVQTANVSSCGNSYLEFGSFLTSNDNFIVSFNGIETPDASHCTNGGLPLIATVTFNGYHQNYVADTARYPLKIVLNNDAAQTYTGSINFSPTAISFNWNYNSGVVFTTKQISR